MSTTSSGFVALPKFILQNPALTPEAIVIYCQLLHFDRQNGNGCFAKRETIAKFSNLSLHKVRKAIKVLEDNGIISVLRRHNSLTDVIRITPDCRPPIKETQKEHKRSQTSRNPAHHIKPTSNSREPQDLKKFKVYYNRDNNTIQDNNTLSTNTPEGVETNHKNGGKQEHGTPVEPTPNPIHLQATQELLSRIKTQIRNKSYEVWFTDTWVENETDKEVTLKTAKGLYVADYIKDNYLSKIEAITGKQVRVIG